MKRKKREKN